MDSSSDSFAWTDASSDSTDSSMMAVNKNESEEESESGNSYKKQLHKHLFADAETNQEIQRKDRKRKIEKEQMDPEITVNSKKKMIKSEPETDDAEFDVPKKKQKTKHAVENINGLHDKSQNYESNDESFLNMKVKKEQVYAATSPVKFNNMSQSTNEKETKSIDTPSIKKLKKNKRANDNNDLSKKLYTDCKEINPEFQDIEEANNTSAKKNKKKSKKRDRGTSLIDDDIIIEDKCYAEETVIEVQHKDNEVASKLNKSANNKEKYNSVDIHSEESNHDESAVLQQDNRNSVDNKTLDDDSVCNDVSSHHELTLDHSETHHALSIPDKTNLRTPRLSDRIRYENDTDVETEQDHSSKNKTQSSKLKNFLKANTDLKPYLHKQHSNTALTLDDDIWVFKCPHAIDVNAFKNKSIVLDRKCKIKIDGQTYEGNIVEGNSKIAMLSMDHNKFAIKNVSIKNTIHLKKRIPKAHLQEDNIIINSHTNFIPLPATKCRHPLFGSNYKKAIKIPAAVSERLKLLPSEISPTCEDKNRRKKHKIYKDLSVDVDLNLVASPATNLKLESNLESETEVSIVKKKKKKKRKYSEDVDSIQKKSKKRKHNIESAEAWESEKAIEENLFAF